MNHSEMQFYTENYLKVVAKDWADLRLPMGGSIDITEIYYSMKVFSQPTQNILYPTSDLSPTQERLGQNKQSRTTNFEDAGPNDIYPEPLNIVLNSIPFLVLLGEPGSGKSTTLQFIALCCAKGDLTEKYLGVRNNKKMVPVLLPLNTYAKPISTPGPSLFHCVSNFVMQKLQTLPDSQTDEKIINELVQSWLREGQLLLLLDGLDEVTDNVVYTNVRTQIHNFIAPIQNNGTKVITTSRLAGYKNLGEPFINYVLTPFLDESEIKSYLRSWISRYKPELKDELDQEVSALYSKIDSQPAFRKLLGNPLILNLIAREYAIGIFGNKKDISRNRAKLYQQAIDELWEQTKKRQTSFLNKSKKEVFADLTKLAWQIQIGETPTIAINTRESLQFEREQLGLLVLDNDRWMFSHATFQEFFVARDLAQKWKDVKNRQGIWEFLLPRLHLREWREPLLLLAILSDSDAANDLIQKVYHANSLYEHDLMRDFALAIDMLAEVDYRQFSITEQIIKKAGWAFSLTRRRICWQIFPWIIPLLCSFVFFIPKTGWIPKLGIFLTFLFLWQNSRMGYWRWGNNVLDHLSATIIGPGPWVYRQVLTSIGKLIDETLPLLTELLKDPVWEVREQTIKLLGETRDSLAIPPLIEFINEYQGGALVVEAVRSIGKIGGDSASNFLINVLSHQNRVLRTEAAMALGKIKDERALPLLIDALGLNASWERDLVSYVLVGYGDLAVKELINGLKDSKRQQKEAIFDVLSKIGPPAVNCLGQIVKEDDVANRIMAVKTLQKIGSSGIPEIVTALDNDDEDVRDQALESLAEVASLEHLSVIQNALMHSSLNQFAKEFIVKKALINMGTPAIQMLLDIFNIKKNKSESILLRSMIAEVLGEINASEAVPALLDALDEEWIDKGEVVVALGKIKSPQAIAKLLMVMNCDSIGLRRRTLVALNQIGTEEAISGIVTALDDPEKEINELAAVLLGKVGRKDGVPILLNIIQSDHSYYAHEAIEVLGHLRVEKAVPFLIKFITIEYSDLRYDAAKSLSLIGQPSIPALIQILKEDKWDKSFYPLVIHTLGEIGEVAVEVLLKTIENYVFKHPEWIVEGLYEISPLLSIQSEHQSDLLKIIKQTNRPWYKNIKLLFPKKLFKLSIKNSPEMERTLKLRQLAILCLGKQRNVKSVNTLSSLLNDSNRASREYALKAIKEIGNDEALYALVKAMDNSDFAVRWKAIKGIQDILENIDLSKSDLTKKIILLKRVANSLLWHIPSMTFNVHRNSYPELINVFGIAVGKLNIAKSTLDLSNRQKNDNLDDLLLPAPETLGKRFLRFIPTGIAISIMTILVIIIALFLNTTQDLFSKLFGPTIENIIKSNSIAVWVSIIVTLGGLLAIFNWILSRFGKHN